VTYEPGRKFTDKINKVILSDSRVQVVSEMDPEDRIGPEPRTDAFLSNELQVDGFSS
jgi:hypothetical protein